MSGSSPLSGRGSVMIIYNILNNNNDDDNNSKVLYLL